MNVTVDKKVYILNKNLQEMSDVNDTAVKEISGYSSNSVQISYKNEDIEKAVLRIRDMKIERAVTEITNLISKDEYIDGEISSSEKYMEEAYRSDDFDCVKEALMKVYTKYYSDSDTVSGILMMISRVPYDSVDPQGTLMALGLLTHKDLEVRDKAIQCFERWNSKKGLGILKNIECSPKWLQDYAEKVIEYIEEEGID